jgi:hypothetical protein
MPAAPRGLLVRSTHFNGRADISGAFPPRLAEQAVQCLFVSMNCRTVFSIAPLCALTACQSPGALAQKAPAWTAVYQVSYEAMANCLVERERLPWVTVTPSTYPAERRATVAVAAPTGSALGVYDIRQISGRDTEVAYRSIYGGPGSGAGGDALEKANRCGNPA